MIFVKIGLVVGLLIILKLILFDQRLMIISKIVSFMIFIILLVFVMYPDMPTYFANKVGITRGADLLFYFSHILSYLLIVILWGKNRMLSYQITILNRELSIQNPDRIQN